MARLVVRSELPVGAAEAFAYHERPGAFERLTPPWARIEAVQPAASLRAGTPVVLRTGVGPARLTWVGEHIGYDPPREFRDVQRSGPFAAWEHRHGFDPLPDGRCVLSDEITYRLPLGPLGALAEPLVRRRLRRIFDYRHRRTAADLALAARQPQRTLTVAITGASGLIGRSLASYLTTAGHAVVPLVRRDPRTGEVRWDPAGGTVDTEGLRGIDAVVHLAAEPIEPRPLTAAKRRRLRYSRVQGTRTIAAALARMDDGPRVLLSASGSNWYGDRGDEPLTEDSGAGTDAGLLTGIAREWEAALAPARDAGLRVVAMRTGIVLDLDATILKVLGRLARLGGAAPVGDGRQYWPWVAIDDTVGMYVHALGADDLDGALNVSAPEPVPNSEFTRTLARVLSRPVLSLKVPRLAPSLLLGSEAADSLLFTSARMLPARAQASGYEFAFPTLEGALRHLYGR